MGAGGPGNSELHEENSIEGGQQKQGWPTRPTIPFAPTVVFLGTYRLKASKRKVSAIGILGANIIEVEFDDGTRAQMTPAELATDTVKVEE